MPVTPFHLGPGMAFKAILRDRFSLIVFTAAQILIDLQPLFAMVTGLGAIHGFSHTYVGASFIAAVTVLVSKPIPRFVLAYWNKSFEGPGWLRGFEENNKWGVATFSAFLGTYSHVALDSIMHGDMDPMWPISTPSPLLGYIDAYLLHLYCFVVGVVGLVIYLSWRFLRIR